MLFQHASITARDVIPAKHSGLNSKYCMLVTTNIFIDSTVYDEVYKALTKKSIKSGILQASPHSQTSNLEGFHSVLNHFAPKMVVFKFPGMYCRLVVYSVHFTVCRL